MGGGKGRVAEDTVTLFDRTILIGPSKTPRRN
jgi:hypothetical protein